jgi:hypothetical protein
MLRVLFRLPVKNSFDVKKAQLRAKKTLDHLDRAVCERSEEVEIAKEGIAELGKSSTEISSDITRLECELEDLKHYGGNQDTAIDSLESIIKGHVKRLHQITNEIDEIKHRRKSISSIINDINIEVNTLSLNEEARRIFLSFSEICGARNCKLFSFSSESYAKNLLYLKDQLKDLDRNSAYDEMRSDLLLKEKSDIENIIGDIVEERNAILSQSEIISVVNTASRIKDEIFRLQDELKDFNRYKEVREKYYDTLKKREDALEKYNSYKRSSPVNPKIVRLRSDLKELLRDWMDKLDPPNVSRDITFRDDFSPEFGKETVSQLKGSTRIRIVLAFHSAILELAAKNDSVFNFLILDTPKQHEINDVHLDQYFKALKEVCRVYGLQVIFSTTEYTFQTDDDDELWKPAYQGEKQLMFMKQLHP